MKVFIRVDTGAVIGDGHLYRCKALASQFLSLGHSPVFVTRPGQGFLVEKFSPFNVITLKDKTAILSPDSTYSQWLGVEQQIDAQECLGLVGASTEHVWLVDHYGISFEWEEFLLKKNQFIVSIDDIFRTHNSHMIIDHNFTAEKQSYLNKYPRGKFLMGPRYALLREDICKSNDYTYFDQSSCLLFLGAVEKNLFDRLLSIIRSFNLPHLVLLNPPIDINIKTNEEVLRFCDDLPSLYNKQRLVFGSCGVANMERMALGVPTVTCSVADNQEKVGAKIEELGVAYHVGDLRYATNESIEEKIKIALNDHSVFSDIIIKAQSLVAKDGVKMIVEEVFKGFKEWQSH